MKFTKTPHPIQPRGQTTSICLPTSEQPLLASIVSSCLTPRSIGTSTSLPAWQLGRRPKRRKRRGWRKTRGRNPHYSSLSTHLPWYLWRALLSLSSNMTVGTSSDHSRRPSHTPLLPSLHPAPVNTPKEPSTRSIVANSFSPLPAFPPALHYPGTKEVAKSPLNPPSIRRLSPGSPSPLWP